MDDETMERWAARMAPEINTRTWRAMRTGRTSWDAPDGRTLVDSYGELTIRARSLLALRDHIASGLDQQWHEFIGREAWVPKNDAETEIAEEIEALGLAYRDNNDFTAATDFGREVAHVLEERNAARRQKLRKA